MNTYNALYLTSIEQNFIIKHAHTQVYTKFLLFSFTNLKELNIKEN